MAFSAKIVLGDYVKSDGTSMVYLQAYIDRQRATVPLGFYLARKHFDVRTQRVKPAHPNANDFDVEMMMAIAKANTIASKFRQDGKLLNPDAFRNEYNDPTEAMDLIKFIEQELELKRPSLAPNTYKSHNTVLNKLKAMQKTILFNQVSVELVQKFRNKLIKDGNGGATIEKIIKILKQYLSDARKKGIAVREVEIKIKSFRSNRGALTEDEVLKMDAYYKAAETSRHHKKILRYFLFSCFTGLRISDIKVLTWAQVSENMLTYIPVKTKKKNEEVMVPLLDVDKQYLPEYTSEKRLVFDTYTEQFSNKHLKKIAEHLKFKKNVTYHTSRHTFGHFLSSGDLVALQRMMGHGDIKTTMGYAHSDINQLIAAKKKRFENFMKS